jgi:hypothetical protein
MTGTDTLQREDHYKMLFFDVSGSWSWWWSDLPVYFSLRVFLR